MFTLIGRAVSASLSLIFFAAALLLFLPTVPFLVGVVALTRFSSWLMKSARDAA